MSETSVGISIGALVIAILGWVIEHTKVIGDLKGKIGKMEGKDEELDSLKEDVRQANNKIDVACERLKALEVKIDLFWKGVEGKITMVFHQPHPECKPTDEILEKFEKDSSQLSIVELKCLRDYLSDQAMTFKDTPNFSLAVLGVARCEQLLYLKEASFN